MNLEVPVLTDPDEMLQWAELQGIPLSRVEVETVLARVGRNASPSLFYDLFLLSLLDDDALRLVGIVWSMAEYPDTYLSHQQWKQLFDEAGYTVDGRAAVRPDHAVRLFRGAVRDRRDDWSWTDDLEVARRYATTGIGGRPPGTVWTAQVPPERLLCRNQDRQESEYVVDTRGLHIDGYVAGS